MPMGKRLRTSFVPRYAALVVIGVAVNYLGQTLALSFSLPLYLDTLGTIVISAIGGLAPGIIVAIISNTLNSLASPTVLYYVCINVLIAIIVANFTRIGAFTELRPSIILAIVLALSCGFLGATLSFCLAGLNIGEGISESWVRSALLQTGWSAYVSQLAGNTLFECADKFLCIALAFVALHWIPSSLTEQFWDSPLHAFRDGSSELFAELAHRNLSLSTKVIIATAFTIACLGLVFLFVANSIYENTSDSRFAQTGVMTDELASTSVDADMIQTYLDKGEDAPGYAESLRRLRHLDQIMDDVQYIYVYRIEEDGCHVVFDTDADPDTAGRLGDVLPIERGFTQDLPTLLRGGEIEPVITDDTYGWLMTVYKPLYDSSGVCQAYVCSDIAMGDVLADRITFMAKLASVLLSASLLITVLASFIVRRRLVLPINRLSSVASEFAFDSEAKRNADSKKLQSAEIRTGDELETLYTAIVKLTDDATGYIDDIADANNRIAHQINVIRRMQNNTILSFATLTDKRDKLTGGHIRRTALYVELLANACLDKGIYPEQIDADFVKDVIRSAPLHDIGKIEISDTLLNKPGRFTDAEYATMKTHAALGGEILQSVLTGISEEDSGYLDTAIEMATHHHERWDGSGYPDGLAGTAIPLCARIMAIADVFDALLSKRSYKKGYSFDECMAMMEDDAGKAFDPTLLTVFLSLRPELEKAADGFLAEGTERA